MVPMPQTGLGWTVRITGPATKAQPGHRGNPVDKLARMQQQAGAGLLAVFPPEQTEMGRVSQTRPRCRLHFDWQQAVCRFDHEVHFLAAHGTPREPAWTEDRSRPTRNQYQRIGSWCPTVSGTDRCCGARHRRPVAVCGLGPKSTKLKQCRNRPGGAVYQDCLVSPQHFPAGHRPQGHATGASGQRLGHIAHLEQIGRSGQQKPSRFPAPIDCALDGNEQVRLPLDLVDGDGFGALHEYVGRTSRQVKDFPIVKIPIPSPSSRQVTDERALARLSGTRNHDGRHDIQPLAEAGPGKTRVRKVIHGMNDNHSHCEWNATAGYRAWPILSPARTHRKPPRRPALL